MENSDNLVQKWPLRKRLEFIDFRLFWTGRVNRGDIGDTFDISVQQASSDIGHYDRIAPGNMVYDRAQKTYLRTKEYRPALIERSSERFLLQLVAIDRGWMTKDETWFDELPPLDVTTLKRRATSSLILLQVLNAIRDRTQIKIAYNSLTETVDAARTIAPHALFFNSGRWYTRAYSADHRNFRDYNLNRINKVEEVEGIPPSNDLDYEWAHTIDLVISPNPELPAIQQKGVAAEFDMVDDRLLLPVRLSMAFYVMSEHNLDVEPGKLAPVKQQLVLLNRTDVDQARQSFRQLSEQAIQRSVKK
ncbi:WYL domain-containing protein [Agrobacterium arsenijevicii]|uniref:Transcriptional regulator n=1 Tax=Agrobacterium arsenijevicii TaxID=1585697 RepID=A0ABR5DCC2_9HYPH|nr:transcriptional regulator [Agrobacterium arsenijevicii]